MPHFDHSPRPGEIDPYMPVKSDPDFSCGRAGNSTRGSTRGPRGPKNTIRDGGSTALCTFGTVYTIYTFYIFDTVDTIYTIETALHCLNSGMYAYT